MLQNLSGKKAKPATVNVQEVTRKYTPVIGLEVHAQLQTKSKIYSPEANAYGAEPNTNISVITLGHPGIMPKLNKKVLEYAIKMGLACNSTISRYNVFDRKNYFYPDLPKGYQLTQDATPICVGGHIPIVTNGTGARNIQLNRIHVEEDAGKSIHVEGEADSLIDYNRAGTPLIEIVTEPDIHTPEEAAAVLTEVRRLVRYLNICDGNMEEGSLRCDANISVKLKAATQLGRKVEVKNMNSIRNVQRACEYEIKRQIAMLEREETIVSETRTFHADKGTTSGMRTKEELNDYRYFPDPDLSPVEVSDQWLESIRAAMPALPRAVKEKLMQKYALPEYDAAVLSETREMAEFFEAVCQLTEEYKAVSNWLMGPIKSTLNDEDKEIGQLDLSAEQLAGVIGLVAQGKVSFSVASQKLLPALLASKGQPAGAVLEQENLAQQSDTADLLPMIEQVLADMPEKVKAYKNGKKGLVGMFMGELMKRSKGKADPKKANELLRKVLNEK